MYQYSYVLMKQFNMNSLERRNLIGAVDIGGTKIAVGVVDRSAHVLSKDECSTDVARGFAHAMRQVREMLARCAERAGGRMCGIGIGSAGPVDPITGALGNVNNLVGWKGGNPVQVLSSEFGLPAALENDADAAALGELYWGVGRAKASFVYVTVGTGIGVSVILDGKLYRGANGFHPEIGHHVLDASGPLCSCGVRGCWESLAAGPAMTAWLRENAPPDYGNRNLSAREICFRAQDSDIWARRAVEREAYYLGLGLANLITLFAPETITLGGSVMQSAHLFLERMHEVIGQNCRLVPAGRVEITLASLGSDAGLIGAAQVWRHRFDIAGVRLATSAYRIVEGQYLRDILAQPRALATTLEKLALPEDLAFFAERLREGKIRRILLTGMGASFHALYPLFLRLNTCGFSTLAIETSELIYSMQHWLEPTTLIVVASQSGQSAEVVRLIEENRGRAAIVAVTNAADSPLARHATALILTSAGEEFSVSCKTYVTGLMVLHAVGGALCGADPGQTREELARAAIAVSSYLDGWKQHVDAMIKQVGRVRRMFLLGRGSSLAAAGAGALILKESVRLHAEAMSGAAFRHGPLELVDDHTFALVFAGAEVTRGLQAKLRDEIRHAGGTTAWIDEDAAPGPWNLPLTTPDTRPLLEILPVQMMTLALAAESGMEAGRFARIPKITTTE